ncbi:MAG TPA: hypothetical protein DEH78_28040, partial [Solibacterales bacterium]|nr:hypothetical protein [Bryobacterales bacterium]
LRDEGPYLLAGIDEARIAAEAGRLRMQRAVLPGALMCFAQFGLAFILLTFWLRSRESVAQLLLGLFLLAASINTGSAVIMVYRGGTLAPWWPFLLVVAYFLLAAFTFLVLEKRRPPYPWLAGLAAVALIVRYTLGPSYYILISFSLPLWLCAKALWRGTRDVRGFAVALLAYLSSVMNILASQVIPGWPIPVQIYLGYMQVWFTPLMTTAAAYALMLFVIRSAAQDRQEKLRLSGELAAAAEIQALLLPSGAVAGVESVYVPAAEVGGDFYQVLDRDDGTCVVVVGDVSGKGLKAAMLVSVAIGILRNEKSSSPAAVLSALNRGLHGQTGGGFVTCCCLRLGERITVANAGHPPPYTDGQESAIPSGLPLGLVAEADYEEAVLNGSVMTLVSDGVIEAANAAGELFGFERTAAVSTKSAGEIAEAARAWGQNDDITVV